MITRVFQPPKGWNFGFSKTGLVKFITFTGADASSRGAKEATRESCQGGWKSQKKGDHLKKKTSSSNHSFLRWHLAACLGSVFDSTDKLHLSTCGDYIVGRIMLNFFFMVLLAEFWQLSRFQANLDLKDFCVGAWVVAKSCWVNASQNFVGFQHTGPFRFSGKDWWTFDESHSEKELGIGSSWYLMILFGRREDWSTKCSIFHCLWCSTKMGFKNHPPKKTSRAPCSL